MYRVARALVASTPLLQASLPLLRLRSLRTVTATASWTGSALGTSAPAAIAGEHEAGAFRTRLLGAAAAAAAGATACYSESQRSACTPALCEFGSATTASNSSGSPFVYPELQAGIQRRIQSQQELIEYMHSAQRKLEGMEQKFIKKGGPGNVKAQEWFASEMRNFQQQVNKETQVILYGVKDPGARDRYMARYGCAAWTDEALKAVGDFSRLIEIGAGKGQWQHALAGTGADVLAFDNNEAVPMPEIPMVGDVRRGDHTEIAKHRDRTLFLCYPEGDLAERCVELYHGDYLLYVGEGRGGVTANERFFDLMERDWVCERIVSLDPFNECFERLYVMRRAKPFKKGWLGWL